MQAVFAPRIHARSSRLLVLSAARHASPDPERASSGAINPPAKVSWTQSKVQAFRSAEMSEGVSTAGVDGLNGTATAASLDERNHSARAAQPTSVSSIIDFAMLMHSLKTQPRTGWVKRGVQNCESISDHMHRMSLLALAVPAIPGVDRDRCIKMALVHDVAEAIVGDITPSCGVSKEEKSRREASAMEEICATLGKGSEAEELRSLWQEYEGNCTPEAKLVKDLDKLEMIIQATEYEAEQGRDLQEFFDSTRGKFQTPIGQQLAAEVVARRQRQLLSQSVDAAMLSKN